MPSTSRLPAISRTSPRASSGSSAREPRDDRAYDAMMAYAGGVPKVRDALRDQYVLLGQILELEVKMVHPNMSLDHCSEA